MKPILLDINKEISNRCTCHVKVVGAKRFAFKLAIAIVFIKIAMLVVNIPIVFDGGDPQ